MKTLSQSTDDDDDYDNNCDDSKSDDDCVNTLHDTVSKPCSISPLRTRTLSMLLP